MKLSITYPSPLITVFRNSLDDRYKLVKSHIITPYYTLHYLQTSTFFFMHQTLATFDMGDGTYLVNISTVNGMVQIDTGLVRGVITGTVYDIDNNPIVI
ncbi:fasciclin-like arabinogalactan protein [Trifolium medium]|uniref:Fasciclin-like arabinogalactan protein n=1 Tax=Trifolium medium TaxID=97028 RepID=A0A392NV73_9FABA|nr:fasciclin-like arabinogalactan protein [Trifolium medium]